MSTGSAGACAKCGRDLPVDARRCAHCGNPVASFVAQPCGPSLRSSQGERFQLTADTPTTIGRGTENNIVISHKSVSRHHAIITTQDESCLIRDLESSNGTFVDGQRIQQAQLTDGNRIRFGEVEWTFEDPRQTKPSLTDAPAGPNGGQAAGGWLRPSVIALAVCGALIVVGLVAVNPHGTYDLFFSASGQTFLGDWSGELRPVSRTPLDTMGSEIETIGLEFNLDNNQAVMSTAFYAPPDVSVRELTASTGDATHLRVEEELGGKNSVGEVVAERLVYEMVLIRPDRIDCTETKSVYDDPGGATPIAAIRYQGSLSRTDADGRQKLADQYGQRGWQKRSKVQVKMPEE
jgi:hypothetical protein